MERFRVGGLSDVNDFTVVSFNGGSDAHMVGQPFPDVRDIYHDTIVKFPADNTDKELTMVKTT